MTSLVLTVTETLRYRGKLGQWAWVLHRITGLGTLLFVFLHVIDTSWATFYPELYAKAIELYQTPIFTLGEFVLVACVVYHAFNGFRIILFDYRPQWWRHQANAGRIVLLATVVLLVPTFIVMFGHVVRFYQTEGTQFDLGLGRLVEGQIPFVVGAIAALAFGLVVSAGAEFILPKRDTKRKPSRIDMIMWSYMRISGVLILPLAFGHLLMIHVIQGVFDITAQGHIPVGTTLGPNVAEEALLAANFVALRWNTTFAGVFIWRVYDILFLILIVFHGFYGARYVVNDYFHNRIVNRALRVALLAVAIVLLVVGSLAIINTVPATTEKMLQQQASQVVSE